MIRKLKELFLTMGMISLCFMNTAHSKVTPTIAVTQIVSHPSLDKIREGILDVLKENGFSENDGAKIIQDNASGNMAIAAQIAQKYASLDPSPAVIVAITTPSAQTINKALQGKDIPLIFAAVTDPIGAGLGSSCSNTPDRVTGTIDLPPMEKQLNLIAALLPNAKKIGILYTLGEPNAVFQATTFISTAAHSPYEISKVGVSKTADIHQAAEKLSHEVDLILLFNDNLMVASLESILKAAAGNKVPVFASDPDSVKRGALAAVANDQYEVGRQTGQMVTKLLTGTPLQKLPPEKVTIAKVYVNEAVARDYKIDPDRIKQAKDMP